MPKSKKSNSLDKFLFDDCAICDVVRKSEAQGRGLSLGELKAAFRRQNKKNIKKSK